MEKELLAGIVLELDALLDSTSKHRVGSAQVECVHAAPLAALRDRLRFILDNDPHLR